MCFFSNLFMWVYFDKPLNHVENEFELKGKERCFYYDILYCLLLYDIRLKTQLKRAYIS